jgi:hypothetical protein
MTQKLSAYIGKMITVRGVRPDANYIDVTLVSVDPGGILVKDGPLRIFFPKENVQAVETYT